MGSNATLLTHIQETQVLAASMSELQDQLETQLKTFFKEQFGFDVPSALQAELAEGNVMVFYSTEFNADSIFSQAHDLLNAAFSEDQAGVINSAIGVVQALVNAAFKNGVLDVGIKNASAKVREPGSDTEYIIAVLSNTASCKASQWFTTADFNATYYYFVVVDPTKIARSS